MFAVTLVLFLEKIFHFFCDVDGDVDGVSDGDGDYNDSTAERERDRFKFTLFQKVLLNREFEPSTLSC